MSNAHVHPTIQTALVAFQPPIDLDVSTMTTVLTAIRGGNSMSRDTVHSLQTCDYHMQRDALGALSRAIDELNDPVLPDALSAIVSEDRDVQHPNASLTHSNVALASYVLNHVNRLQGKAAYGNPTHQGGKK